MMRARAEVFLSLKAEAAQSDGLRTPAFPSSAARRASGWLTYIGRNGARWRMEEKAMKPGLKSMMDFRLVDALLGRCSRRFFMGAEIPDCVFSYRSSQRITPLSELEKRLVAAACGARSGWNHLICRAARYARHLSNYTGSAEGSLRQISGNRTLDFVVTCLQAQHLDAEFYDRFHKPGSYLKTHAEHMERWHS